MLCFNENRSGRDERVDYILTQKLSTVNKNKRYLFIYLPFSVQSFVFVEQLLKTTTSPWNYCIKEAM